MVEVESGLGLFCFASLAAITEKKKPKNQKPHLRGDLATSCLALNVSSALIAGPETRAGPDDKN
jgi:hypothetical protein